MTRDHDPFLPSLLPVPNTSYLSLFFNQNNQNKNLKTNSLSPSKYPTVLNCPPSHSYSPSRTLDQYPFWGLPFLLDDDDSRRPSHSPLLEVSVDLYFATVSYSCTVLDSRMVRRGRGATGPCFD